MNELPQNPTYYRTTYYRTPLNDRSLSEANRADIVLWMASRVEAIVNQPECLIDLWGELETLSGELLAWMGVLEENAQMRATEARRLAARDRGPDGHGAPE